MMIFMPTMTKALMGILKEIDTKSAFGTINMHIKTALRCFAMEFHDQPAMTKRATMTRAKTGILIEIDTKSVVWSLDVHNKAAIS